MSGRYEVKTLVKRTHGLDVVGLISATGETLADISSCPNGAVDAIITELNALLDRAEKAEARVAELEAQVAKAEHPQRRADTAYEFRADVRSAQGSGKFGNTEQAINSTLIRWFEEARNAKTAPKTPVPAPEPTETVQTAPPPSPAGAPRSDQGGEIETDTGNPGPGRIDPRGSESSLLDTPMPRPSRMPDGIVEAWQDGGRVFGTYSGGPRVELVPVPPDDGPVRTFVVAPQRALTAEEADAYTELLGNELADAPKRPRPPRIAPREPDVSAEVGLMGALQDRIHKEAGPYRAAKVARVEASPEQARADAIAKAKDDVYRMSMDILARAVVTPEQAAEVEARTGEVRKAPDRIVWEKPEPSPYFDALSEKIKGTLADMDAALTKAIHEDGPCVLATITVPKTWTTYNLVPPDPKWRMPPRAGLPSRDEVAAFLEGRWPK